MANMDDKSLIKDGDHVMLKKENNLRLFQVNKSRDIWLDKAKFSLAGVIGHPFGTLFEVKEGQMVKMDRVTEQNNEQASCMGKDNRNLLDLDSNQKLTQEEIEQMKREGVSGSDLINQLIENSTTFQGKTGYAQQKWVKKKKKKHLLQYSVLKPNARLLCELQWSKGPSRICNLRVDSLSQILTMGNVRAGSTVMVVDSCLGLVTGAVLERLAGYGKVVSFYSGDNPIKTQLESYDFSEDIMNTLYQFPLEMVNSLKYQQVTSSEETVQNSDVAVKNSEPIQPEVQLVEGSNTENVQLKSERKQDSVKINHLSKTPVLVEVKPESMEESETCSKSEHNNVENVGSHKQEVSAIDKTQENLLQTENLNNVNNDVLPSSEKDPDKDSAEVTDPAKHVTNSEDNESTACANDSEDKTVGDKTAEEATGSPNRKKLSKGLNKKRLREERKVTREQNLARSRDIMKLGTIDCLIVATKFHPTPITLALVDYLAPSRQVVVFSQFQEALKDCYVYLREHKGLVNYRLTETWMRNYQVLPNRTHPVIQMTGTGGYLLTATTILQYGT